MKKSLWSMVVVPVALVAAAALARLLPHPPNVAPLGAMALFGAWRYGTRRWWAAMLLPLAAMLLSDVVLNNFVYRIGDGAWTWFYAGAGWTYAAMALTVAWGWVALRRFGWARLAGASVGASTLFFVVSNFGVWAATDLYPPSAAGLGECYVAALPFFGNALLGDALWSAALFGAFALASAAGRNALADAKA